LRLVVYFGLSYIITSLLEKGADVDSKDSCGRTPLSWAAENGHEVVVKLLLAEDSAKLNIKVNNSRMPLYWGGRERA